MEERTRGGEGKGKEMGRKEEVWEAYSDSAKLLFHLLLFRGSMWMWVDAADAVFSRTAAKSTFIIPNRMLICF